MCSPLGEPSRASGSTPSPPDPFDPAPSHLPAAVSDLLPRPSPTVLCKEMDEGAVLFCSRTEVYFGLNPVGVLIWSTLSDGARTLDDVVEAMQIRYPDEDQAVLRDDAREFLDTLTESELLVPASAGRGSW